MTEASTPGNAKPRITLQRYESIVEDVLSVPTHTPKPAVLTPPNTIPTDLELSQMSKSARRRYKKSLSKKQESESEGTDRVTDDQEVKEELKVQPRIVRGMINSGNTCFLNVVFQVLMECGLFVSFFRALNEVAIPPALPLLTRTIHFVNHYENGPSNQSYNPQEFVSCLSKFNSSISSNPRNQREQQDAQEYLNWVLDRLHEECTQLIVQLGGDPTKSTLDTEDSSDNGWEEVGKKNQVNQVHVVKTKSSAITQIFRSQIRNMLTRQGTKNAAHIQPYFCLPLDIHPDHITTLDQALKLFLSPEYLGGRTVTATQMSFEQLPPVLCIQLGRFWYENDGGVRKINKFISFPKQLKMAKNYLSDRLKRQLSAQPGSLDYSLFGVVVHHGHTMNSGHYTCDVYNHKMSQWLHCNDCAISYEIEREVLNQEAYLLFYINTNLLTK